MTFDIHATGAQRSRVLALAVDAPNHALLLQWMDEGKLPNLSKLRMKSQVFTLLSEKRFSNEHCWIPVLTGRKRERWSHWLDAWDPKTYQFKEASLYDWIEAPMFYALGERRQVVAFDLAAPVVDRVSGVQVTGFAAELNECYPQSQPPGLLADLLSKYGVDPKLKQHHRVLNGVSQREGLSWITPAAIAQNKCNP